MSNLVSWSLPVPTSPSGDGLPFDIDTLTDAPGLEKTFKIGGQWDGRAVIVCSDDGMTFSPIPETLFEAAGDQVFTVSVSAKYLAIRRFGGVLIGSMTCTVAAPFASAAGGGGGGAPCCADALRVLTGSTTITPDDVTLLCAFGAGMPGAVQVFLPDPAIDAVEPGHTYTFRDIVGNAVEYPLWLLPQGVATIEGGPSFQARVRNGVTKLTWDGTMWRVMSYRTHRVNGSMALGAMNSYASGANLPWLGGLSLSQAGALAGSFSGHEILNDLVVTPRTAPAADIALEVVLSSDFGNTTTSLPAPGPVIVKIPAGSLGAHRASGVGGQMVTSSYLFLQCLTNFTETLDWYIELLIPA